MSCLIIKAVPGPSDCIDCGMRMDVELIGDPSDAERYAYEVWCPICDPLEGADDA